MTSLRFASPRLSIPLIAAASIALATPALAVHRHHHRAPAPYGAETTYPQPAYYGGWQAEAIARATAAQRASPGLTEELAPDAKETATGGPVGGVPGFSGGK